MAGMGAHQSTRMESDDWLTPPDLLAKLGKFDLDPCASINQPWATAKHHLTREDDGLYHQWNGHVFCNPPYGRQAEQWLERMAQHNNGIALTFARTEIAMFHKWIWQQASGLLFLAGRLKFCRPDGTPGKSTGGAPSCLVAYGQRAFDTLAMSNINGQFINLDDTWRTG